LLRLFVSAWTPRTEFRIANLAASLGQTLGAKVAIEARQGGSGRLVISYSSLDQLDGILARLK